MHLVVLAVDFVERHLAVGYCTYSGANLKLLFEDNLGLT